MPRFRKQPIVVEARRWDGDDEAMDGFCPYAHRAVTTNADGDEFVTGSLLIPTLEGEMLADPGDWIIRGVAGEFYPCKPDIFDASYDGPICENCESPIKYGDLHVRVADGSCIDGAGRRMVRV